MDDELEHLLRDADARRHLGLATPLAVERGRGALDAGGARVKLDIGHRATHSTIRFSASSSTDDDTTTAPRAALDIDELFRLHGDKRIEATPSAICCLERLAHFRSIDGAREIALTSAAVSLQIR
jgi:hypothetical protein